ncbi:MAG: homoserine dehydrogenase [Candidatus Omnitrophica bacterium]|nr:homoserine dehydrogenase [Candidatus Omnitrophota bacterium]
MKKIRIGLIGLGNIGTGVYEILTRKARFLEKKTGAALELRYACDQRISQRGRLKIPRKIFVRNPRMVLKDPSVDIVIELIGGIKTARTVILEALRSRKHVVTANKALLAECGPEIFRTAVRLGREIFFEASVGGGIPIIKTLRESFAANRITAIHSIINGTCNYILTRMSKDRLSFDEALRQAQEKGYAEADPTLDISGADAAHKITILAMLAFEGLVPFSAVSMEGITGITSDDITFAHEFGYVIKLLAIAKKTDRGIEARVQPTLLPAGHILANVDDSFNGILLHGDEVGDSLLYGRGAGRRPTASAVVSDVIDLARLITAGQRAPKLPVSRSLKVKNLSAIESRYYLRFTAVDRPGVLSRISSVLARQGISISDVIQKERRAGKIVPLILLTHHSREDKIRRSLKLLNKLSVVRARTQVIRIED